MIMKECNIVKDLIPIYMEDLISEESKEYVEKHLKECEECRLYAQSDFDPNEVEKDQGQNQLELFKKNINKRIRVIAFSLACLLLAAVTLVVNYMTTPLYYNYADQWFSVEDKGDLLKLTAKNKDITKFSVDESQDMILVEGYTTRWDMITRTGLIVEKSIEIKNDKPVFYNNKDEDARPLNAYQSHGGVRELPRLALRLYFAVSAIIVGTAAIAFLFMKAFKIKTGKFKYWLMVIFLPAAYLMGALLVNGGPAVSYNMSRDFLYIMISGIASMAFITSIYSLIKNRI